MSVVCHAGRAVLISRCRLKVCCFGDCVVVVFFWGGAVALGKGEGKSKSKSTGLGMMIPGYFWGVGGGPFCEKNWKYLFPFVR